MPCWSRSLLQVGCHCLDEMFCCASVSCIFVGCYIPLSMLSLVPGLFELFCLLHGLEPSCSVVFDAPDIAKTKVMAHYAICTRVMKPPFFFRPIGRGGEFITREKKVQVVMTAKISHDGVSCFGP